MLLGKPVEELTAADMTNFIKERVPESLELDYKRDLPATPADWEELYADVCSFANTAGGYIIYGVEEEKGFPKSIVGVVVENPDQMHQRLNQRILSNLRPRPVPIPRIKPIEMTDGRYVFVIYVPRSWQAPHAVVSSGEWTPVKAWARNSAGKYMLDISQLRTMILSSASLVDRVRQFRYERISKIMSGDTPVRVAPGPHPIVHYMPASAFTPGTACELESLGQCRPFQRAVAGLRHRYNLEGRLYATDLYGPHIKEYIQVFRTGIIEHVMEDYVVDISVGKVVANRKLRDDILRYGEVLLKTLKFLNASSPVWIAISLVGYKDYFLDYYDLAATHPRIDRDLLMIDEFQIDDLEQVTSEALRPMLDLLWQAGGFERCPY